MVFVEVKRVFELDFEKSKELVKKSNFIDDKFCYICDESIFEFVGVFVDVLVDKNDQQIYNLISRAIKVLMPRCTINIQKELSICLSSLRDINIDSYNTYIGSRLNTLLLCYPVQGITERIQKYLFERIDEIMVNAMKILLNLGGVATLDVKPWVDWIFKLHTSGFIERNLKSKMDYLCDLVDVSMRYLNQEEIQKLILEGDCIDGVNFFKTFMSVTYKYLTKKPFILLLPGMEKCNVLLKYIVKYSVKRNVREEMEDVAQLVVSCSSILLKEKLSLLVSLQTSLAEEIIESINLMELEDKIQVVMASNNKQLKLYKYLIPSLPSRISELSGVTASCFRLILDMMDIHDSQLTNVLVTLAANDPTKGWWDDAIHMCMSSIAKTINIHGLTDIYRKCFDARSTSACERVLLPLLRYSKPSDCEEFFSINLENILALLKDIPKTTSDHISYDRCVLGYIKALYVIQVIFEKIPKASIESPRSILYNNYSGNNFISEVCKLCFTLRGLVDTSYRSFHCANYNCLVSVICLRDPKPQIYATVFGHEVWKMIIDEEEIKLPITEQWNQRITRHATSSELSEEFNRSLSLRTSSVRTRMFTRTLSEHPFQFDLVQEEAEVQPQELWLADNPLNRHPCIASLTALLRKQKALEGQVCRDALVKALESDDTHVNLKWLLTQAICNNKEELKTHANILQPALLSVITITSMDNKLNGIHIDILDTLILWNENTETPAINPTIDYIIQTAIDYKQRKNVYAMLVDKLVKLLTISPNVKISWSFFEKHFEEKNPDIVKVLLNLLKHIVKSNKYIPELVPAMTKAVEEPRTTLELAELYGVALNLEKNNEVWLKRFRSVLTKLRTSDVKEYIKLLFYVHKGYPQCCDHTHFRTITDLVPKLAMGRDKLHCLQILGNCIGNAKSDDVTDMFHTIGLEDYLDTAEGLSLAKSGLERMPERVREDIVSRVCDRQYTRQMLKHVTGFLIAALKLHLTSEDEPAAKKLARESKSLLISNEYTRRILKVLTQGDVREVGEVMNEDLGVRLCESFYIAIILTKSKSEESLYVMLDLFFQGMKENMKTRDETIVRASTSSTSFLKDPTAAESGASVNKELTTEEILSSLLNFCKKNTQAALSLINQLMNKYAKGPGFASMGGEVVDALHCVNMIEIVRSAEIWDFDGLQQRIEGFIKTRKGTEAEVLSKLLYEDYKLRKFGPEQFYLGSPNSFDETMTEGSNTFCIEDLISAFGKLSNWDDLTLQQRNSIKQDIPSLWTTRDNFEASIQYLKEEPVWLNALVSTYMNKSFNCHNVYKWPKNYFDVSVIAEMSNWREIRETMDCKNIILSDMETADCMAQWAARIMMRSVFVHSLQQLGSDETNKLSRSLASAWCDRASEMALHEQILHCCKSVTEGIFESETLKWLRVRMLALRAIGLEKNDMESLRNTLNLAETYIPKFLENSSLEDKFGMRHVTLLLKKDLNLLENANVENLLREINRITVNNVTEKNKKNLEALCVFSMNFYDNVAGDETKTDERILIMSKILSFYTTLNLGSKSTQMADIIINKLHQYEYFFVTNGSNCILDALHPIITKLSPISIAVLKSRLHYLPGHVVKGELREQQSKMEKYNKCVRLIGDPEYLLLHYCDQLNRENDVKEWKKIFINMKIAIFENPYAGPDYQVLYKYKEKLYQIADYDEQRKKEILLKVISQLKPQKRDYLRLSQLCPTLTCASEIEDNYLSELLYLKPGVKVVRFEEKILVFKDSIRRPSVLKCRLTDGRTVQCIVKQGESVRTHCGAVAIVDVLGLKGGYRVTPLSADCCVIEYLENHERFRTLIYSAHPVDNIPEIEKRTKDSELVLDPKRSLQQYKDICNKVPPYILRSAIEANCVSVEDFIYKKKNFFECICDMTVSSYICDMSDRHLENLMYNIQDGGACHVDCGAILQDGGRGELPPARLTRNILGLCDAQVLESRLQNKLLNFRDNQHFILPSTSIIFTWMGQRDKLPSINNIIQGKTLSYHKTIQVISESELADKDSYIQILEDIFKDFPKQDLYCVEKQVSCLLRQSTDPRILSLTRSLWEPWL